MTVFDFRDFLEEIKKLGPEEENRGKKKLSPRELIYSFFPENLEMNSSTANKAPYYSAFLHVDQKNNYIQLQLLERLLRAQEQGVKVWYTDIYTEMKKKCAEALGESYNEAALYALMSGASVELEYENVLPNRQLTRINPGMDLRLKKSHLEFFNEERRLIDALVRLLLTIAMGKAFIQREKKGTKQRSKTGSKRSEELNVKQQEERERVEWLWERPEAILTKEATDTESLYMEGRKLYAAGEYAKAFDRFVAAINLIGRVPARNALESRLYCCFDPRDWQDKGDFSRQEDCWALLRKAVHKEYPRSYYLVSLFEKYDKNILEDLTIAANLGCVEAALDLGMAYLRGEYGLTSSEEDALRCFLIGCESASREGAQCAYYVGKYHEDRKNIAEACKFYRVARSRGHQEAAQRLLQLNVAGIELDTEGRQPELDICFVNQLTGYNAGFVQKLPTDQVEVVECASVAEGIREKLKSILEGELEMPRLCVALLSADRVDNLQQAVKALSVLERFAQMYPHRETELIDRIDLFVLSEKQRVADEVLDAVFAGMRTHFKLIRCNDRSDAMDELFSKYPLFLPCIGEDGEPVINLTVLSDSIPMCQTILKKVIALPVYHKKTNVNVLTPDPEGARSALYAECPGLLTSPELVKADFTFSYCPSSIEGLYHEMQNGGTPVGQAIANSGYYIIATEAGTLNLELGIYLRQHLLKRDETFSKRKLIAVYSGSDHVVNIGVYAQDNEEMRGHITQNPVALHGFGVHELYTWTGLKTSEIERMGRNVHLFYYGNPESKEEQRKALSLYYKRGYNRTSSRAMVLALSNRMYSCGIAYDEWMMYTLGQEKLARAFDEWLRMSKPNLERAAAVEHARWNAFMLSDGWTGATEAQLKSYVRLGWPGHQHYAAKLHPFIVPWERLTSGDWRKKVEEIVHKHYPEKRVADPVMSDKEAVQATEQIIVGESD